MFRTIETDLEKPSKFTYPFYYRPHPLAVLACNDFQKQIPKQNWGHDFEAIGKMFGILVCQDQHGKLGYLAAVSGKLLHSNTDEILVPPIAKNVDDTNDKILVEKINSKIDNIENSLELIKLTQSYQKTHTKLSEELKTLQNEKRLAKMQRKIKRESGEDDKKLNAESIFYKRKIKDFKQSMNALLKVIQDKIDKFKFQVENLKLKRNQILNELQFKKFDEYKFLNIKNKQKSLYKIFADSTPPSGAGDCAAPKLLQYAFENKLKPICMAEFWWGAPHKSAIRKHLQYYPACRSKCEPILNHMLDGLEVEENPMLTNYGEGKEIEILFEDEDLIVINKPEGLLSVPGKMITDSVASRFSDCQIIHRLDQETSGIMILAKNKNSHKKLQEQFINRSIKKTYCAIIVGRVSSTTGSINLPLRVDLDHRPRQLVCYDYGKKAITDYKVIKENEEITYIEFYPKTGRTHQLRMHAAHSQGLAAPIKGDTLYGTPEKRLYLHASQINFVHPKSNKQVTISCPPSF